MEVSTFELLIKPIAPRSSLPVNLQSAIRRVVQGYFLNISNLESQDLRFRIEFFDSTPNPPNNNRRLTAPVIGASPTRNFDVLYDIAGANLVLGSQGRNPGDTSPVRSFFTLPARQTATVQLLPSLIPFINESNPDLEIRGFVRLALPVNIRFETNPFRVIREPQAERPVKVLLQPEIRGTFLPNNFPTQSTGDFDQISYSLGTASGKALNEIEPERPFTFNNELITSTLQRLETTGLNIERLQGLSEIDQAAMIIESLSQIDTSPENLEQVSNLLAQANISIRMSSV